MIQRMNEYKFSLLYLIVIIAIVYGIFAGNLVILILGVFMFAWLILLRLKTFRAHKEDEEDEMEVNDEHESI